MSTSQWSKVMMYGRHLEDTLSVSNFEITYLQNIRRALYNIYYTRQKQNKRAVERICNGDDHAAQEHRAGVAHEHLCGVVVPDKKAYAAADEHARHERDAEKFMHIGDNTH